MTEVAKKVRMTYGAYVVLRFAGVAELADAHGSGPCGSNTVWVQVPSPACNTNGVDEMSAPFVLHAERVLPQGSRSPLRFGRRKTEVPRTSWAPSPVGK